MNEPIDFCVWLMIVILVLAFAQNVFAQSATFTPHAEIVAPEDVPPIQAQLEYENEFYKRTGMHYSAIETCCVGLELKGSEYNPRPSSGCGELYYDGTLEKVC